MGVTDFGVELAKSTREFQLQGLNVVIYIYTLLI